MAMLAYKTVVTLDAPLQFVGKSIQGLWRSLIGSPADATRSWLAAKGIWHFLTHGLAAFWRA